MESIAYNDQKDPKQIDEKQQQPQASQVSQSISSSNYPRSDSINSFLNNFNLLNQSRKNSINLSNDLQSAYPSFYINNPSQHGSQQHQQQQQQQQQQQGSDYSQVLSSNQPQNQILPPPNQSSFLYSDLPFNPSRRPSEQLEPFVPSIASGSSSSLSAGTKRKRQHSILPSTSIINENVTSDFDNFLKRDSLSKSIDLNSLSNFAQLGSMNGSISGSIGGLNNLTSYLEDGRSSIGSISGLINSLNRNGNFPNHNSISSGNQINNLIQAPPPVSQQQLQSLPQSQPQPQPQPQSELSQIQEKSPIQADSRTKLEYPTKLKEDIFLQKDKSEIKSRRNAIAPKIPDSKNYSPHDSVLPNTASISIRSIQDSQQQQPMPPPPPPIINGLGATSQNAIQLNQNIFSSFANKKELVPTQEIVTSEDGRPLLGATKIDQLMLVIQARDKGVQSTIHQAPDGSILDDGSIVPQPIELVGGIDKPKSKGTKQHQCHYCFKKFTQSTHLEVHVRSHIGYKPFECNYCHKKFTQGGNLRTHLRLHTGEKPFRCEVCQRCFSRKGNLAAHKLTHENLKPYECKLDGCNKSFTQLGNLKAHQNRFHLTTLNELTRRLAELGPGNELEKLPNDEKFLLNYFKNLYKNSNRGIRGRGKRNFGSQSPEQRLGQSSYNSMASYH